MHNLAPTRPYMFDLAPFKSTSTDAPRSSTQSNPSSTEILPDTTGQSQPSSELLIYLASSMTHGLPLMTQSSATGCVTGDSMYPQASRFQLLQTQWHPSFYPQRESSPERFGFQ